ncbi:hypothetical protein ES707_11662 [subsurface metagenome]
MSYEIRYGRQSRDDFDLGLLGDPYKVEIIDYTTGTEDPLTLRHAAEMDSLQGIFAQTESDFLLKQKQHEKTVETLGSNLENLAQLDKSGIVNMIENNFNLILIGIIAYFLMGE